MRSFIRAARRMPRITGRRSALCRPSTDRSSKRPRPRLLRPRFARHMIQTPTVTSDQVLVVGAGPSGISSAYYLEQAGIPYRVVDRAGVIASTWANLYPSLRLNTAGFVSHLPGKRIPLRDGIYPFGKDFY